MQDVTQPLFGGEEVAGGIDDSLGKRFETLTADWVETIDGLYLVVPKRDTIAEIGKRREDIDRVALDAETSVDKLNLVAHILRVEQLHEQGVAFEMLSHLEVDGATLKFLGIANAIDTADGAYHDDIASSTQQCRRSAQTEFVKFLVDGKVLLNISVGSRNIGFGLIVVVVGDKILDGIVGEKLLELAIELGGKGLVVAHDQGGATELRNDIGHGKGLARPRHALQHLCPLATPNAVDQLAYGLRLVAHRGIVRY